jgi:hypothetical protein
MRLVPEKPIKNVIGIPPMRFIASGGSGDDRFFKMYQFRYYKDLVHHTDRVVVAMAYS